VVDTSDTALKTAFLVTIVIASMATIPGSAFAIEKIVVRSITVSDAAGNGMTVLKPNVQFIAAIHVSNFGDMPHEYVTVFEIRNSQGITAWLSFESGMLERRQSTIISTALSLSEPGDYSFRAFAIDGGQMPKALSPVTAAAFSVRDASYPGIYIPLYKFPDLQNPAGVWNTLFATKRAHPSVLFVVTVNPSSGPGNEKSAVYANAISELKRSGVEHILGYIPTDYSRQDTGRTIHELKALIDRYADWYPEINGMMFDEMHADASQLAFYTELAAHARAQGMEFIRANPGTKADESYRQIFDNLAVYEGRQLPSVMQLQGNTYFPEYPPEGFSFTARGIPTLDPDYVEEVKSYVGLLYITDDIEREGDGNPYNSLPSYFAELVQLLDS
jgi:hypothetical protein